MDRKELIHTWSTVVAEDRDKSIPQLTIERPQALILDPTIAEKQLEFEHLSLNKKFKCANKSSMLKLHVNTQK